MRLSRDLVHNHSPEYRQALQELIRFELQALIERLSVTGEEALILTASTGDGTLTQFGSTKAEGFLQKHASLGTEFLSYCNDENTQSSADELANYEDDHGNKRKDDSKEDQDVSSMPFPSLRKRERTTSKRLSITETPQDGNIFEVSQNSDISASERNDSASSVSSFVEAKQNKNELQCKICSRTFGSYRSLNQHFRLHLAKSYKCGTCGKIFTLKKSYQRHMKTHGKDKQLDCGICDKTFPDKYSLQRHREMHVSVRNYSCSLCGKAFYEKYSLRVHETSHFHPLKFEKNLDPASGYPCHICQKLSKTKTALKNHMLTHSAKKHTCEFCNKRFSLKYSYVRHRRIHTGERPYKCGSCDKSFSDGSAWTKHVRTHSGIKPYSCSLCSKSFMYKTACTTHMKNHQSKKTKQTVLEKRNFQMVSSKDEDIKFESSKVLNQKQTQVVEDSQKLDFESDLESPLYDEELNLRLEESDKDYEGFNLLDSGFEADIIPDTTQQEVEKEKPALIDSVDFVDKFQTEFVERDLPIKGIESVNELISAGFPDDSDILADDTETEHQPEVRDVKVKTKETSQLKQLQKKIPKRPGIGKQIPETPTKCKKCRKVFNHEYLLKQHLQFHCMMKLYKCRFCGKQLSTQHSLVRHERIHIGDRPYQCYLCQKKFADNYSCIRHIKQHFTSEEKCVTAQTTRSSSSRTSGKVVTKPQSQADIQQSTVNSHKADDDMFSDVRSSTKGFSNEESFQNTSTFKQVTSTGYKLQESELTKEFIPITKQSDHISLQSQTSSQQQTPTCSCPSTDISSVSSSEISDKKQLFKCFACTSLFDTQQKCLDHIGQGCGTGQKICESGNCDQLSTQSDDRSHLKSLYQCSLCSKMFNDESSCQDHIREQCLKTRVSSECPVQSLLTETLQYSDLEVESQETLPQLPFSELDSDQGFLDVQSEDVMYLTNQYSCTSTTSTTPSKSASSTESTASNYIPVTQLSNQSSSTVQFCSNNQTGSQLTPPSIPFTGLVQKSLVNLGQSKFFVTNQGISLVTSSKMGSSLAGKPERFAKKEKGETDISERTCSICNKVFTNKHILKQHTLIHMERKFGCKFCMKKFHNKYGRDRHERIHTGEKPFSCPNCKKAFSDNSTYRKHTRVCCSGK